MGVKMPNQASTTTAFALRLRLHYKVVRVGGVGKISNPGGLWWYW